jgi:hypothetical protein
LQTETFIVSQIVRSLEVSERDGINQVANRGPKPRPNPMR